MLGIVELHLHVCVFVTSQVYITSSWVSVPSLQHFNLPYYC